MTPSDSLPSPSRVAAIDIHAHFGAYKNSPRAQTNCFMSADAGEVVARARQSDIAVTIVSPLQSLMPRGGGDVLGGNADAYEVVSAADGALRQWVVIDPRKPESFVQADQVLQAPSCAGIKIHPEEHVYQFSEFGRTIFAFAAARGATILSHSGEQNSLPADLARFADDFPTVNVILAHLGCGWDGDLTHQIRAIQSSRHGNVYTDTSSAASLTPRLIEWAVGEVGAAKILFGTDAPLYSTAMQRARIDHAEINDADRQLILRDNALRLLTLGDT